MLLKDLRTDKDITVEELIAQLQQMPPKSIVELEGCDCVGEANGCLLIAESSCSDRKEQSVVICRTSNKWTY